MNRRMPLWLGALSVSLSACGSPVVQPTTMPTSAPITAPVAHNSDWKPVIQKFKDVEMVKVPPGCFMMGIDTGRRDERPVNKVCIDAPYWIDRYEVTNALFGSPGAYPGPNRPRDNLTWIEARDFCVSRGARLPSEAEWEFAARGPDNLIYPWGNELVPDNLVFDHNMNNNEPQDVGSRPGGVSWVGAFDLSGNVWEWTSTIYKPYPYSATDGRENDSDTTSPRVYRGGWLSYQDLGTSAVMRFKWNPTDRQWHLGFRCAQS